MGITKNECWYEENKWDTDMLAVCVEEVRFVVTGSLELFSTVPWMTRDVGFNSPAIQNFLRSGKSESKALLVCFKQSTNSHHRMRTQSIKQYSNDLDRNL
jgi:hypothetical protein